MRGFATELDHLIPVAEGGANGPKAPSCRACNNRQAKEVQARMRRDRRAPHLDLARGLDRADQVDELVAAVAVAPGELDELAHARVELALLWRRHDRDAPTAPDLE